MTASGAPEHAAGTSRGRRALALAAFAPVLLLVWLGPISRVEVLESLHVGLYETVAKQIEQGRESEALESLETGSLIDADEAAMLDRMARLNQAAGVGDPSAGGSPFAVRRLEAELRFRVGSALYSKLSKTTEFTSADRETLERGIANAKSLVVLEPDTARSHFLLGILHLLRWRSSNDASERWQATAQLEQALVIEPTHSGARRALDHVRLARERAR